MFAPVPRARLRPVYPFGRGPRAGVLYTCPVSAIPEVVWDVLSLWASWRAFRVLPRAGGFLDQPMVVQRYFPVLEAERAVAERAGDSDIGRPPARPSG